MRDHGASKERQIAELGGLAGAKREERLQLIDSVYLRRGSAPDVRAAIETECIAEKERLAQAAALAATALRIQGGTPAAQSASTREPGESDLTRLEARQRAEIAAGEEDFKKSNCANLATQQDNLRRQERAGGSVGTMNRLSELRHALDEKMRSSGC